MPQLTNNPEMMLMLRARITVLKARMNTKRIIILDSGFDGVKCADTLREELALDQAEVVHLSCEDQIICSLLLAEVACRGHACLESGSVEPCAAGAHARRGKQLTSIGKLVTTEKLPVR
jgi:hypothetical protein